MCLDAIVRAADDDRNFAKKAVSWALRQIGKRNRALHGLALETCDRIDVRGTRACKWIARDARRELTRGNVLARLDSKRGS